MLSSKLIEKKYAGQEYTELLLWTSFHIVSMFVKFISYAVEVCF